MFELSVACKYLIPRRRQLSVSIISLISVLVIALVVWLIVVFFSVTDGLEKSWVQKLTALTAPVRITPTEAYYQSYYYQLDNISEASNYSSKTISEKLTSTDADPYDPNIDEEIPSFWPVPDLHASGELKDLVKLVYSSLEAIPGVRNLKGQIFELTATHIRLQLLRPSNILHSHNIYGGTNQSSLSYPAYLGNFEKNNTHLGRTLLPIESKDLNNVLYLTGFTNDTFKEDERYDKVLFEPNIVQKRIRNFFSFIDVKKLKTRTVGWTIPWRMYPSNADWEVCCLLKDEQIIRIIAPQQKSQCRPLQIFLEEQGLSVHPGVLSIHENRLSLFIKGEKRDVSARNLLTLAGDSTFPAELDHQSIERVKQIEDLQFKVTIPIQETTLEGKIFYKNLEIAESNFLNPSSVSSHLPLWISQSTQSDGSIHFQLPNDPEIGEGIILPKSFKDAGVMIGDRGSLSYLSTTASVLQEQHIPIFVGGFYDPGIIPIGGKFILANPEITALIRSSHQLDEKKNQTNGINVRFDQLDQADHVKQSILKSLKQHGISRYWNVETYREYEFTKDIMQELQSQKNLFMLIAVVIILVACSNIVSMLIILVNDKKIEIGILRSMGATSKNIALIFGLSGALIGILGSTAGILAAVLTLHYLDSLISLLSRLQGHEMFTANLYGQILPHELSYEALSFVLIATICISLLAGIVPAIKACLLRPSQILRSSGG